MTEKVKLLFTGPNDAKFKTGDKMVDIVRKAVKKHGIENVTLVSGGNEKSVIDRNIKKIHEYTDVPIEYDLYTKDREQQRIDNNDLEWHSFNKEGKLDLKDRYEGWARETYENLGKETIGKGDVRPEGSLRFPKNKYKTDAQGKPTKELKSSTTLETSKFKSFLDILESEKNPQKVISGIKHAKKLSDWTQEKHGYPLITEKNEQRIKYLEFGEGLPTGQTTYTADADEPELESTPKPQQKLVSPKKLMRKFKGPHWGRRIKLEDTAGETRKIYIDDTRSELNEAGLRKLPFKAESRGTLLAPRTGVRNVTKSFEVKEYGTVGSTYDHKAKKAIPKVKNYTVKEIKKISSGSKNPPPQKFVGGPDTYSKSSSLAQLENTELAEPVEHREAKRKALQDVKTIDIEGSSEDKSASGSGVKRHLRSYGESGQKELNKDLTKLIDRVKQLKSISRKNRRILRTGSKQPTIGTKSPAVKRLFKTVPDVLTYDKQSQTAVDVKKPQIYGDLADTTKAGRDKKVRAEIKKGPSPFGYGTSKERAIKDSKTGIVTAKARNTVLTGKKALQIKPSQYPSLWKADKPIVKYPSDFWNPSKTYTKTSKKLPLPKPKTKAVTTSVTPKKPRVQWWRLKSAPKPSKKVVTTTAKKVSSKLQKVFHKPTGTANVEDKHKKLKFTGKGISFTRGLGAFSLGSTILAPIRARKEAKEYTGKKDPSFFDTMKMMYPILGKPRKKHGLNYGDL